MKMIDWRLFDVSKPHLFQKKNDKSFFIKVLCDNNNCQLIKNNQCVAFENCPYAKRKKEFGYTKRAKKYSKWLNEKLELIKNVEQKSIPKKMSKIDDTYIYFNYPHWNFNNSNKNSILFKYNNKKYILVEDFNKEFILAVIKRKPCSLFGGEILTYQKEIVPKIIQHLKEEFFDLYQEIKDDIREYIDEDKIINNVGRIAYISTLKVGAVFKKDKYTLTFNGESLDVIEDSFSPNWNLNSLKVKMKKQSITFNLKVSKDDVIQITDNNQCNENTLFQE